MDLKLTAIFATCFVYGVVVVSGENNGELQTIRRQLQMVMDVNRNLKSSVDILERKMDFIIDSNRVLTKKYESVKRDFEKVTRKNKKIQKSTKSLLDRNTKCLIEMKSINDILDNTNQSWKISTENQINNLNHINRKTSENRNTIEKSDDNKNNKRLLLPTEITTQAPMNRIAFFARVSGGLNHLGDNQIVPMKMELIDTVNAFHSDSGIFEAPKHGLFAFFATITSYHDIIEYEMVKNGAVVAYGISQNQLNKWASSSVSVLIQLSAGDHVYIRIHGSGHSDVGETIGSYSHFMGFNLT